MSTGNIEKKLNAILPDRPTDPSLSIISREELINKEASDIKASQKDKELAKLKLSERSKIKSLEAKRENNKALAEELGLDYIPDNQSENVSRKIAEHNKIIKDIEEIEAQTVEPLSISSLTKSGVTTINAEKALRLQGTSRPEMLKLLASLNINLSIQLTKQDTANLLACLLTCNEAQLNALYNNKKVPIVIKTVIKRLQQDVKLGNIDTIERLWDRVFGKGQMQLNLPEASQLQTGIIPNVPVSREAYIVIKDTLLK